MAAEQADVWNTNGQYGAPVAEIVAKTRAQNDRLDELCLAAGRDPATLRRQFLLWDTTDPLLPEANLEQLVADLTEAGIEDFVLGWPETEAQQEKFTHLTTKVIPTLR